MYQIFYQNKKKQINWKESKSCLKGPYRQDELNGYFMNLKNVLFIELCMNTQWITECISQDTDNLYGRT